MRGGVVGQVGKGKGARSWRTSWATGRTLVLTLSEMGAIEGFEADE